MTRICTEFVPTFTTRDGRQCGYHRAWVESYDPDRRRFESGPAFDGQTRAEAIGNCILGTADLRAGGVLTIIDRGNEPGRHPLDAAAVAAHVDRAKGGA